MVEYWNFHNFSFALKYLKYLMSRPWCDTPHVFNYGDLYCTQTTSYITFENKKYFLIFQYFWNNFFFWDNQKTLHENTKTILVVMKT
jgi:hypothetical protein